MFQDTEDQIWCRLGQGTFLPLQPAPQLWSLRISYFGSVKRHEPLFTQAMLLLFPLMALAMVRNSNGKSHLISFSLSSHVIPRSIQWETFQRIQAIVVVFLIFILFMSEGIIQLVCILENNPKYRVKKMVERRQRIYQQNSEIHYSNLDKPSQSKKEDLLLKIIIILQPVWLSRYSVGLWTKGS